jgi:hypothetical protein
MVAGCGAFFPGADGKKVYSSVRSQAIAADFKSKGLRFVCRTTTHPETGEEGVGVWCIEDTRETK